MVLDVEDLVVVGDDLAEEVGVAAAGGHLPGATEEKRVDVVGGGDLPVGESGDIGVAGVEERAVAGLHLRDQGGLLRRRAGSGAELQAKRTRLVGGRAQREKEEVRTTISMSSWWQTTPACAQKLVMSVLPG